METNKFFKRFFIGIGICLIFGVALTLIFINRFNVKPSPILKRINNKESFLILITNSNKNKCEDIEKTIIKYNFTYEVLSSNSNSYNEIISKLNLDNNDVTPPSIIFISSGKAYSILPDINNIRDVNKYLDNLQGG